MNKVTDPTPAPPLQGRGVPHGVPAPPLEGRGVPHGVPAAGKAAAAPLPCRGKATGKATGRRVSGNGRAQLGNGAGVGSVL